MKHKNEKTAEVLDTLTTVSKEQSPASLPTSEKTGKQLRKEYATLQAQFSLLGRVLNRVLRARSGRISVVYIVSGPGEPRHFDYLHDVVAYLAALMEVRL